MTARARDASAAATDAAFQRSGAAQWGVTRDRFAVAVDTAVAKRFERGTPDIRALDAFIESLHAQDLALACACADGRGDAWDHFVVTFRPELYRAARAMTDDASGRELADSLYADLYGMPAADGRRRSLLAYYHGRSKLSTWLRSVLSQRHVDLVRSRRRLTSLDDLDHPHPEPVAPPLALEPDESRRMTVAAQAVSDAIRRLEPHDRLRLAYYYVHGLTLAQAGTLLGEHEATASRKLEKARKALRQGIEAALTARGGRVDEIESWADVARQAWDAALADSLGVAAPEGAQASASPPFKGKRTP